MLNGILRLASSKSSTVMIGSAPSRIARPSADRFAAENGLGEGLISALKKLSRDNFSNLNPHPFLSMAEDSHPTTAQRIRAIRAVPDKKD